MAGRKSDFTLTKLDDLFSTQEQRDEEKLSKIRDIPLTEIDDFPDHPFKVRDDEDMMQLVESVKERGVITPATVRQKEDGRYELVSGHRRKRACELAGFELPKVADTSLGKSLCLQNAFGSIEQTRQKNRPNFRPSGLEVKRKRNSTTNWRAVG